MKRLLLIFVLALAAQASAQQYYADVSIEVRADGSAGIEGVSNHPFLQPQTTSSLTSKKGEYWLFNLTLPEEDRFSDYIFSITLPAGAEVNYVKTSGGFRITSQNDRIGVVGTGDDMALDVVIQYRIRDSSETGFGGYLFPAAVLVFLAAAVFLVLRRKAGGVETEPTRSYPEYLTDRQKDILRLLEDSGKPVNQALVCDKLGLPKSSVSRNVNSLVKLGLVEKTRVGVSTFLSLKK